MNLSIKIKDFKKKYNDALKRARDLMSNQNYSDHDKHLIETIFPELKDVKEDENTRIKKVLIDYFQQYKEQEDCGIKTFYGISTENILDWIEKQSAPKDIDISSLKPGSWIVHNTLGTCKIVNFKETVFGSGYDVVSCNDGISHFIGFDFDEESGSYSLSDCHLWTIYDTKDGDMLVNGGNIFIFHYIHGTRVMGYCHVNTNNGRFYDDIGRNECFCLIDAVVNPATKEQRNLLFQKMKEEGYEWDVEKKELKEIKLETLGNMTLNEYQHEALSTAIYDRQFAVIYPALGIAGEAGECADKVKKILRDTHIVRNADTGAIMLDTEQQHNLALEIGDVLWYCATLARDIDMTLEEVAELNIAKLNSRKQRGKLGGSGDNR